jgi:hypothetical protein
MYHTLPNLPDRATEAIEEHLKRKRIPVNKYRHKVGLGRSQCLGLVRKRSQAPDLSRQSWIDAKLHYLLEDFGQKHVPISYTSVQVNDNYVCAPHKDVHNFGLSYIVAFGDFTGGNLKLHLGPEAEEVDIHTPRLFNGSEIIHSTTPWVGQRFSLVYHTLVAPPRFPLTVSLTQYKAIQREGQWVIQFLKPDGSIEYLTKDNGLPHVLKGRKKPVVIQDEPIPSEN